MLSIRLSSALSSLLLCFLYRYSLRYNLRFFSLFFSRICFLTRLGLKVLLLTPFAPLSLPVHFIRYFCFIRRLPPLFSLFSLFFRRGPLLFLHSVLHCFLLVPLLSPCSLFLLRFLRFLSRTLRVLLSNPIFRPFLLLVFTVLFLFSCCPPRCFFRNSRMSCVVFLLANRCAMFMWFHTVGFTAFFSFRLSCLHLLQSLRRCCTVCLSPLLHHQHRSSSMVLILFRCVLVKAWVVLSRKYRVAIRFVVVMAARSGFWCSGAWYPVLPSTRLLIYSFDSFVRFSLGILFRWAIDVKLSAFDMHCTPFWLGPLAASLAAWSAFSFPAIFECPGTQW
jgi:hypothetical protein